MRVRRLVVIALLSAAPALGAGVDPTWFEGLHWRLVGPFRGGRVVAVTGVPGEPEHFYFGAVNGGVWESRDAGRTWVPVFDGQPVGSIGAIAVAPSNPKVLYVGTGEADMRSDISQGDGMYRSTDGGATWHAIGLEDSQQIGRILVHPGNPDLVYVAALGHPYGPNPERGVFRSSDGGRSWQKVLGPDDDTGAIDLAFSPGNPDVVYATLWQTRRTPWSIYPPSNGPGSGVYRSADGGDHWVRLNGNGLPEHHGRVGLALARTAPERVYAVVDGDAEAGLYRSDDGGGHWRRVSTDPRVTGRGWYFGRIEVDPTDADRVWALNTIVLRSDDGGGSFVPDRGDPTGDDFHDLWVDPSDPRRRILGTDQGTIVTVNGGATWSSWLNQPTAQIYRVATDDAFPYNVYGAQQDSGAVQLPSRTTDRSGITSRDFRGLTAGGENGMIAPDPKDPGVIFGGRVERLDLRSRQTRDVDPTLAFPGIHRRAWTLPLTFSHREPGVLYFANQHLYRTGDGGGSWRRISPDLTRKDPGAPANLDAATAALRPYLGSRFGVIFSIAPSRLTVGDLWVGTDDGLVWRTRDEGAHWRDVTPAEITPWSKIATVETSPHDPESAYLAVDRHRLDDFSPYVYRTHDGGAHWQLVVRGIADRHTVNVVREDPVRPGLLFAGTERGVYVSFDDGDSWQPLQLDLPVTSVRDLEVKGRDLVIATHGRGFWILDDISRLRQLGPGEPLDGVRLFDPSPAVRLRPAGFTGTPLPKEEPAAANPPLGAIIDYVLPRAPSGPVVLTIRDADGGLVRRYSSDDRPPELDPATLRSTPEWVNRPVTLSAAEGGHRFVWPLHEPAAPALAEGDPFADGVWSPPGRYTVELEVDGVRLTRSFDVLPDPRVGLPAGAYAEQHALASAIERARARVADATDATEKLQAEVSARRDQAPPAAVALLDAFLTRIGELTGVEPREGGARAWWLPPRSADNLSALAARLRTLQYAVDGADAAPSPDARSGFEEVELSVSARLGDWERLRTEDLATLDRELDALGQPPLSPGP